MSARFYTSAPRAQPLTQEQLPSLVAPMPVYNNARPVYLPVAPVVRADLDRVPVVERPPAPAPDMVEQRYLASQLNDRTMNPFDFQPTRPYPGTQVTRNTPSGKPASVVLPVPKLLTEWTQGPVPNTVNRSLLLQQQFTPADDLRLVWQDEETPGYREVSTLGGVIEYILGVHAQS